MCPRSAPRVNSYDRRDLAGGPVRAPLGEPHHHAYVVDDIEATVNRLVDQFGAEPFFLIGTCLWKYPLAR